MDRERVTRRPRFLTLLLPHPPPFFLPGQALEILAEALLNSPGLTAVDLDSNQLGPAGAALFVPVLTANAALLQFRVMADLRDPATGLIAKDVLKQLTAVLATHKPPKKGKKGRK